MRRLVDDEIDDADQEPAYGDREGDIGFLGRIPSRDDSDHEDHGDHEEVAGDAQERNDRVPDAAELLLAREGDESDEADQPVEDEGPQVRGEGDGGQADDPAQDAHCADDSRYDDHKVERSVGRRVLLVEEAHDIGHLLVLRHREADAHAGVHRRESRAEDGQATVKAMMSMKAKPFPPRKALPSWIAMSPIGAPEAAAAAIPLSLPSADTSLSLIA